VVIWGRCSRSCNMPTWFEAGLWGLIAGSALLLVDTMIPEAFESSHNFAGLIAVVGFLAAFTLSKLT